MKEWIEKNAAVLADTTKAVNTDAAVTDFKTELEKLTADDVGTTVIDVSALAGAKDAGSPVQQQLFDLQSLGKAATLTQIIAGIKNADLKTLLGTAITTRNTAIADKKTAETKKAAEEAAITDAINAITAVPYADITKAPGQAEITTLDGFAKGLHKDHFKAEMKRHLEGLLKSIEDKENDTKDQGTARKDEVAKFETKLGQLTTAKLTDLDLSLRIKAVKDAKSVEELAPPAIPPVTVIMTAAEVVTAYLGNLDEIKDAAEMNKVKAAFDDVNKGADDAAKAVASKPFKEAIGNGLTKLFNDNVKTSATVAKLDTVANITAAIALLEKFEAKLKSFEDYVVDKKQLNDLVTDQKNAIKTAMDKLLEEEIKGITAIPDNNEDKLKKFNEFKVKHADLKNKGFASKEFVDEFKALDTALKDVKLPALKMDDVLTKYCADLKALEPAGKTEIDAAIDALSVPTDKPEDKASKNAGALKQIGTALLALLDGPSVSKLAAVGTAKPEEHEKAKKDAIAAFETKYKSFTDAKLLDADSIKAINEALVKVKDQKGPDVGGGKPPVTPVVTDAELKALNDKLANKDADIFKAVEKSMGELAKVIAGLHKIAKKGKDDKGNETYAFELKTENNASVDLIKKAVECLSKEDQLKGLDAAEKKTLLTLVEKSFLPYIQGKVTAPSDTDFAKVIEDANKAQADNKAIAFVAAPAALALVTAALTVIMAAAIFSPAFRSMITSNAASLTYGTIGKALNFASTVPGGEKAVLGGLILVTVAAVGGAVYAKNKMYDVSKETAKEAVVVKGFASAIVSAAKDAKVDISRS